MFVKRFGLFLSEVSDFHDIKVMEGVHIRLGPAQAILLIPLLSYEWVAFQSDF